MKVTDYEDFHYSFKYPFILIISRVCIAHQLRHFSENLNCDL
jgi:hypothetical protein